MIEILLFAMMISVLGVPFFMAGWILKPLDRAAMYHKANSRFMMIDFFGLMFLIQLPIAVVSNLRTQYNSDQFNVFFVLFPGISLVIWATAIATFAKAGVVDIRTRATLVFGVLPIAYFGSVSTMILVANAAFVDPENIQLFPIVVAVMILLAMGLAGRYTRNLERRLMPPSSASTMEASN